MKHEQQIVYSDQICTENDFTSRTLRNMRADGLFPAADGNLCGRLFWLVATYQRWKQDLLAGKYSRVRRLPGQRAPAETDAALAATAATPTSASSSPSAPSRPRRRRPGQRPAAVG